MRALRVSTFRKEDIEKSSRHICKGRGKFLRWEIRFIDEPAGPSLTLISWFRLKDGRIDSVNMAL